MECGYCFEEIDVVDDLKVLLLVPSRGVEGVCSLFVAERTGRAEEA